MKKEELKNKIMGNTRLINIFKKSANVAAWIFGIFLCLVSIIELSQNAYLSAILFFLLGLFLIPPIFNVFNKKINLLKRYRISGFTILLIIAIFTASTSNATSNINGTKTQEAVTFANNMEILENDKKVKAEQEEAAKIAKAEADKAAQEEAAKIAKAEADKAAQEEAAKIAKAEADKVAQEEAAKIAKAEADKAAQEKTAKIAQAEANKAAQEAKIASVQEKSYTVYITKTGSKYHRSGCKYLKKSSIQTNLNNAISDGYTACKVCKP